MKVLSMIFLSTLCPVMEPLFALHLVYAKKKMEEVTRAIYESWMSIGKSLIILIRYSYPLTMVQVWSTKQKTLSVGGLSKGQCMAKTISITTSPPKFGSGAHIISLDDRTHLQGCKEISHWQISWKKNSFHMHLLHHIFDLFIKIITINGQSSMLANFSCTSIYAKKLKAISCALYSSLY